MELVQGLQVLLELSGRAALMTGPKLWLWLSLSLIIDLRVVMGNTTFFWVRYNASKSTIYRIGQIMSLLDNNVTFYTPSTHTFSSHPKEKYWHKTQLNCCIETKYRIMNSLYWCLHYLMTVTKGFLKVMETKMEHFGIKL